MRTIAIGDIHGCYKQLEDIIVHLSQSGEYNKDEDKIVFLGDYIDRGEDSRRVVAFIRKLQEENPNVIALMGNHEKMLIDYYDKNDYNWTFNGHINTIKSYDGSIEQMEDDIAWMKTLPIYHEDKHFIFVHAGIDTSKTMEEQDEDVMLWVRENFIYTTQKYNKRIIFGHTPTINLIGEFKPVSTYAGNICIDTGCVFGGALTAVVIEDGEITKFYKSPNGNNNEEEDEE